VFWQPELITDKKGNARVHFPLADNITTWRLYAVASTSRGDIGTTTREVRVFQPFFLENDPPRFLTVGDEIAQPITLRNYLDHALRLNVDLQPQDWMMAIGPTHAAANVNSGDSANQTFRWRAEKAVKDGKHVVKAAGRETGDA